MSRSLDPYWISCYLPGRMDESTTLGLLLKLHIPMSLEKPEISNEIEMRRSELHLAQVNDLLKVAFTVAPVQRDRHNRIPSPRRITFPLVLEKVVERQSAHSLPP